MMKNEIWSAFFYLYSRKIIFCNIGLNICIFCVWLLFYFIFKLYTIVLVLPNIKWIHHRYTCVPHPEPSSLLPPYTIPLGRPSALAPSIQYCASNLDWVHRWTKNRIYLNVKCVFISKIIFGLFPSEVRWKGYGYFVKTHRVSHMVLAKTSIVNPGKVHSLF